MQTPTEAWSTTNVDLSTCARCLNFCLHVQMQSENYIGYIKTKAQLKNGCASAYTIM